MWLSRVLVATLNLLLFHRCCESHSFKYVTELHLDEYQVYKYGITEDSYGTLFPNYPAQIVSCHFDIDYKRFHDFNPDLTNRDQLEYTDLLTNPSVDDYFDFMSPYLQSSMSSCYQNFVTRYCMMMKMNQENSKDAKFKVRMCKHMYFPKIPELRNPMTYAVREVKPYINFHMKEHHSTRSYDHILNQQGIYPIGFEYFIDWQFMGYSNDPSKAYDKVPTSFTEVVQGTNLESFAQFTILRDSWKMMLFQILHESYWTALRNYRGLLSHDIINAYQEKDHILLHYLVHACTQTIIPPKCAGCSIEMTDVLHAGMCPNPCRDERTCFGRPHTSGGECIPLGVGRDDFRCICLAGYEWNEHSLSCDESFSCNVCVRERTRSCVFVPTENRPPAEVDPDGVTSREGHLRCECYPEFEGEFCQRLRNPCQTAAEGRRSGNELCRVDLGGKCTPMIGTTHYVCTCHSDFRTLKSIAADNCLIKRTACDSVICANNGECYNSPNGRSFLCKCTQGYQGKLCEVPVPHEWTSWSDWTACDSMCGQGWQVAQRVCWDRELGRVDNRTRCPGDRQVARVCHKHCLMEIQASHYMAIGKCFEILFYMLAYIIGIFLIAKIVFDVLFRESDYAFVRYLRTFVIDLVRRAVREQQKESESEDSDEESEV